jgi:TetR/AcrR family transcriptional regulator, transcriptional repressor for nem operon
VIETRLHEIGAMLAAIEAAHATPRERLKALFGALAEQSALIARHGCPHGSLCQELGKRADGPGLAAEMIRVPVDWAERQFQAMGSPDARNLAVEVIARYQGIALLASTFRDPSLMEGESRRVARWIDALG